MKLAVIGAGSTYTPELVSGLMCERERIDVRERALLDAGHRAIGLCNVAITFQRHIAGHLGVAPDRVLVDQVGLNHLTWIRAVWLGDRDVLPEVLSSFGDALAQEIQVPRRLLDA